MVKLKLDLPENFLEEEVRDGYIVSTEVKKVWAVELDLLHELMRVCKKYQIKFYAAGGTILGAVRHKGFIPWDDDIDLMMMRSEFERLCEIAPHEFSHPYFFQTEETDPGSYRGHAQLRNSMTTGILKAEYEQKRTINQGVFIDIFPLDTVPDDFHERQAFYKDSINIKDMLWEYTSYLYPFNFHFRKNLYLLFRNTIKHLTISREAASVKVNELYDKFQKKMIGAYKDSNTLQMSPFCMERFTYNKEDLQDTIELPFEMLSIPVPAHFESILNKTYGEWKKFVIGGSLHSGVFFDTEKPYTEYLK